MKNEKVRLGIVRSLGFMKYLVMLCGVLIASLCLAGGLYTSDIKTFLVYTNGEYIEITTRADTVGEAFLENGFVLEEDQVMNYDYDTKIEDIDSYIIIKSPITMNITIDGENKVLIGDAGTVSEILVENGIELTGKDILEGAELDDPIQDGLELNVVRVEYDEITEIEYIDFEVRYVEDPAMLEGRYDVITDGKIGQRTRVYRIEMHDGVEVARELISDMTDQPQERLIYYGTKEYFQSSRGDIIVYSEVFQDMTATAYSPTPENWYYQTYTGNRNREGGIAVDPTVIPLNTKVYIKSNIEGVPDYGYAIAWDIGGSIKGNKVDLFMELESDCVRWGIKPVTVYILEDQSVDIFALRG